MLINDITIIFVFILILILSFIFYLFYKESKLVRQIDAYEEAIKLLNRKFRNLEKSYQKEQEQLQSSLQHSEENLKIFLNKELKHLSSTLLSTIKTLKNDQGQLKYEVQTQIEELRMNLQEYISVSPSSVTDESQVVSLHRSGKSIDDIARELGSTVDEITLILELNKTL